MIEIIKRDTLLRGFIIGLIAPLFGFYFFNLIFFHYWSIPQFINHVLELNVIAPVLSLSIIFNGAVFFLFLRLETEYSARGVLLATMLYGIAVIYFKFMF